MRTLFIISYAALWGIVAFETLILRQVVTAALSIKRRNSRSDGRRQPLGLPVGAPAPDFSGPLVNTSGTLTAGRLKGRPTGLLFVSPVEAVVPGYPTLVTFATHTLWHKLEGHMYFICSGNEQDCERIASAIDVACGEKHRAMVVDEEGRIARAFQVATTPMAVELDEDLRIIQYGYPKLPKEADQNENAKNDH